MPKGSVYMLYAQRGDECTCPALGEMLPDYVVELLSARAAEEVEDHLLDCLHCRETYLKMLSIEAPRRRPGAGRCDGPTPAPAATPATVVSMAEFKRGRL